jgi:cell wall-associated NlpC family hydrolase
MIGLDIEIARSCIGTPFHHQGRKPGVGLDCIGLLVVAGKHLPLVDCESYPTEPDGKTLMYWLVEKNRFVQVEKRPGSLLVFAYAKEGVPQHVGVWTGSTIIHTSYKMRKVIENRMDDFWEKKFLFAMEWSS